MQSPAIIFHTIRPPGLIIYLILLIKDELRIASKNDSILLKVYYTAFFIKSGHAYLRLSDFLLQRVLLC